MTEENILYFYVHSRSDSSKLVGRHIANKKGPFICKETGELFNWKEWKKDSKLDKALHNAAEKGGNHSEDKHPDQHSDETIPHVIYRENLVDRIHMFWIRRRSVFPFAYHRMACERAISQGKAHLNCLVNHTPGEMHLTQKSMLVRCLVEYYGERGYFDIHPQTFILSLRARTKTKHSVRLTTKNIFKKLIPDISVVLSGSLPRLWILKPSTGSCGRGIKILDLYPENPSKVKNLEEEIEKRIENIAQCFEKEKSPEVIVQSYVDNPLLYKGFKFDFRIYLMIASVKEPFIALYTKQGYLRVCSDPYDRDFNNRNAHITNFHVQRDHPLYDPSTDSIEGRTTRVEYNDFIEYLKAVKYLDLFSEGDRNEAKAACGDSENDMIIYLLNARVHECIKKSVQSSMKKISEHVNAAQGQFAILGIDLLLDTAGNVWLIEFTKSPAFRMAPAFLEQLHTKVLCECVDIATEVEFHREKLQTEKDFLPSSIPAIQNSTAWSLINNMSPQ